MAGLSLSLEALSRERRKGDRRSSHRPAALTPSRRGLQSRLIRVFALQAALVSLATALGVYSAYLIVEDVLVREALADEAEHYWQLVDTHGHWPLPNTANMKAWLTKTPADPAVPEALQALPEHFFGRVNLDGQEPLVWVSHGPSGALYLVFRESKVTRLALVFGVLPLTAVLILIYVASWFTFRQSQRVISPVTRLAAIVEEAEVRAGADIRPELESLAGTDADVDALVAALSHYAQRMQQFVERERSFTRDASHELRTPLAVLRAGLDLLEQRSTLDQTGEKTLARMRRTLDNTETLLSTLLLLAREEALPERSSVVRLNTLVPMLCQQLVDAMDLSAGRIVIEGQAQEELLASEQVVSIVLQNLLRNAIQYGGKETVTVKLQSQSVTIIDQGPGMSASELEKAFQPFHRGRADGSGHGLGLAICRRICERFGWRLRAHSEPGNGTRIAVTFGLETG